MFDHVRGPKIVRLLIVKYVRIFLQHGFDDFPPKNFLYRASFLAFLWGLLGEFESSGFSVFIWSISVSDSSSAKPSTVGLVEVSFSWLKLASITYSLLADASVFACLGGDVNCVGSRSLVPTLVSAQAESIPWMSIVAGSMYTRDGNPFPFSKSNLAVTTCRHFGTMVTYCAILTNHDLLYCAVSSKAWLSSLGQLQLGSSLHSGRVYRSPVYH